MINTLLRNVKKNIYWSLSMIKAKLKKEKYQILCYMVLFSLLFISVQIGINLLYSEETIENRSKEYHCTHTEISILNRYDKVSKDCQKKMTMFLKNYPGIDYYENEFCDFFGRFTMEPYLNNGYNEYRNMMGKPLSELKDGETAASYAFIERLEYDQAKLFSLGEKTWLDGLELKIVSAVDNLHKSELIHNIFSMPMTDHRKISFDHFTTLQTFEDIKKMFPYEKFGKKYRVYFYEYSKQAEEKFFLDMNDYFTADMNWYIKSWPFYKVLEASNNINQIIGVTVQLISFTAIVVLLLTIYLKVSRDYQRNKYTIGVLKTLGISDRKIIWSLLIKYGFIFIGGIIICDLVFYVVAYNINSFRYSMIISTNLANYGRGLALFLSISVISITVAYLLIKKKIDVRPRVLLNQGRIRKNNVRLSRHVKFKLALKYIFTEGYLKNIVVSVLFLLLSMLVVTVSNSIGKVYTEEHFGLKYDMRIITTYDSYQLIKEKYAKDIMVVTTCSAQAVEVDAKRDEEGKVTEWSIVRYVPVTVYNCTGELENFLTIDYGKAPDEVYGCVVGYQLANDMQYEVGTDFFGHERYYFQYFTNKEANKTIKHKIQGVSSFLYEGGYCVYTKNPDDYIVDKGITYMERWEKNGWQQMVYVNLKEGFTYEDVLPYVDGYTEPKNIYKHYMNVAQERLSHNFENILIVSMTLLSIAILFMVAEGSRAFVESNRVNAGIYMSIGMTRRDLYIIILYRNIILAAISTVISVGLYLLLSPLLITHLGNIMGVYQLEIVKTHVYFIPVFLWFMICIGSLNISIESKRSVRSLINER